MLYKSTIQKLGIAIPLWSILFVACSNKTEEPQGETAAAAVAQLPVDVIVAKEEPLAQEEAVVGTLMPYREVAIVSELPQKITQVAFKDGSFVSQGAVLYKLNDADIRSRLKQIQAELELARLTKDRLSALLKTETVRPQEHDEALMRLRSLEAQQELLRVDLEKTVIRAPFSGKIGISKVHLGAYVSPGMELVVLQDQSSVKILFSISEKYVSLIKMGQKIRFTSELSDQQHSATITATEPGLDAQGRSLQVQAITANTDGHFRAGLSAKVYFAVSPQDAKGILVPTEALAPGDKGYSVFIINDGQAKITAVTISNRTEKEAIITSGLSAGDSIIVSNMLRIADGTPVKAVGSN
ncbi:efflux RND transporter periplasmic adaptor subunit [Flavobacterium sp. JP2137]|uniref:efflux RND transporter periplasmic adaptor subunit n=1 Tax=Flavobacterium sp. JP2137 TaxID=3414510 RepID=UPI003D2FB6BA